MTETDPVRLCAEGRIAPNVALARLVLAGLPPEAIAARLAAEESSGAKEMQALLARCDEGVRLLTEIARLVSHDQTCTLDGIRRAFDSAARLAPALGVAAYALGDPALLRQATSEVADWLDAHGLLGPQRDVLDFGCGTGRIALAVAPRVRSVLGVDLSAGMIAEARRRAAGYNNVRFTVNEGNWLPARVNFDLILAVDVFPYLAQAGLAERQFAALARRLPPGGAFVIMNLSYGGDEAAQARRWALECGLRLETAGAQPFPLWDGTVYLFLRPQY